MIKRSFNNPAVANVLSILALFCSLGLGGAWAMSRDSVGPGQIRDGAVRSQEVRNGSLTGQDVDTASLRLQEQIVMEGDTGVCDPEDATFIHCAGTTTYLPVPAKVAIQANGIVRPNSGAVAPYELSCQLEADHVALGSTLRILSLEGSGDYEGFGDSHITDQMPAGSHTFDLTCSDSDHDARISIADISVIAIRAG